MKPATVALVDDEPNILETVGFALRREGYRVDASLRWLTRQEVATHD